MRERSTVLDDIQYAGPHPDRRAYYYVSNDAFVGFEKSQLPVSYRAVKGIKDVDTTVPSLKQCGALLPLNPVEIQTESTYWLPLWTIVRTPPTSTVYKRGFTDAVGPTSKDTRWVRDQLALDRELDTSLLDQVELAAAAKAAGEKWDVLTLIAELKSTVETIRDWGLLLSKRLNYVFGRHRSIRTMRDYDAFLRGGWLSARYGLRPIVYDIISAIEAFNKLGKELAYVTGRALETQRDRRTVTETAMQDGQGVTKTVRSERWLTRSYRSVAYVGLDVEDELSNIIQFDPELTAWETIPFSFIVDRFIDFGAYISTIRPYAKGDFLGRCLSVRTSADYRQSVVAMDGPGLVNWDPEFPLPGYEKLYRPEGQDVRFGGSSGYSVESYKRWPVSGPLPLPSWNPRLDTLFVVDLLAIFVPLKWALGKPAKILQRR